MPDHDLRDIATSVKLAGHPLHPMLIPFPIALMVATLACDLPIGPLMMPSEQLSPPGHWERAS